MLRINRIFGILLLISLAFLFKCCKKTTDTGNVIFYTNAQALMNCGPFDVHVFIEGREVGILSQPHLPLDDTPSCSAVDTPDVLVISKKPGFYNCTVKFDCSSFPDWNSSFEIKTDSCSRVFIDVQVIDMTDTIYIDNVSIPTITQGYYGQLLRWQGDFMPENDNPGTVTPVKNEIYIYHKLTVDKLVNARVDEQSWNF